MLIRLVAKAALPTGWSVRSAHASPGTGRRQTRAERTFHLV